jgi:hypothetical protein
VARTEDSRGKERRGWGRVWRGWRRVFIRGSGRVDECWISDEDVPIRRAL